MANLVNEAALLAGRTSKLVVEKIDFIQAVERSIAVKICSGRGFLAFLHLTIIAFVW